MRRRVKQGLKDEDARAAIWLAGLLAASDVLAADWFAALASSRLPVRLHPRAKVSKEVLAAMVGPLAPSPLELLAARPSTAVLRLWRVAVPGSAWPEGIGSECRAGLAAAGMRLAATVADEGERMTLVREIAELAAALSAKERFAVIEAAAPYPEAVAALLRRADRDAADGRARGEGASTPVSREAAAGPEVPAVPLTGDPPAEARAPDPRADGGVPPAGVADAARSALGRLADAYDEALQRLTQSTRRLEEVENALALARRSTAAATARAAELEQSGTEARTAAEARASDLARRLGASLAAVDALKRRVAELEAEVQALQGFGTQRFQAGRDELKAQLTRDLSLPLEHVSRFAATGSEPSERERHLLMLVDGIARELAEHGVVVAWR